MHIFRDIYVTLHNMFFKSSICTKLLFNITTCVVWGCNGGYKIKYQENQRISQTCENRNSLNLLIKLHINHLQISYQNRKNVVHSFVAGVSSKKTITVLLFLKRHTSGKSRRQDKSRCNKAGT